jgi:acetolactate synthase I/II/III large subunit
MKVSDKIAELLELKGIKHVFGIVGAGNVHIFNSILDRGFTQIICVHNEQAATMAIQTYYRTCGIVTAAILTTGAGSTNGVTGVVSAWADSIPCVIISGNEHSKYMEANAPKLRMYGVQGYDSHLMVDKVTKYNNRVMKPEDTIYEIEKAFNIAVTGRPGPCWVDVPMNIQSSNLDNENFVKFVPSLEKEKTLDKAQLSAINDLLKMSKRPVIWLGHGIRLSGAQDMLKSFVEDLGIPSIVSWAGIDMIDSDHYLVYGRAGVYGQRSANFVLQNCDFLICIGTRLAIPQVGYDINEFARDAKVVVVDIDQDELQKYTDRFEFTVCSDAKLFMKQFYDYFKGNDKNNYKEWIEKCDEYRANYPVVNENDHPDVDDYINSYPLLFKLSERLKRDDIVVTDMGTALLSGHQVMKFKEGQRLMTSTGLGEMGYGLPAAMGASFATNKGSVICLNCDGGMMLNLQELQTIVHHNLPIKIFIFNNEGYLMIKHTQKSLFNGKYSGTDPDSGVSCPDFGKIAAAFGIKSFVIKTWEDFEENVQKVLDYNGTVICEIFMHPEQYFVPKLSLAVKADGSLVSPPLEDLSPLLSREELSKNMIIGLHPKSESL